MEYESGYMEVDGVLKFYKTIKKRKKREELQYSLQEAIICDSFALAGGQAKYFDGTPISSKKAYAPKTDFGVWLRDFCEKEVRSRRKKFAQG